MGAFPNRPWWMRLLVSLGAGAAFAVLVAIALTIVDLYLSGHGYHSLSGPLVDWPAWGVHLSLADLIFLSAAVLGAGRCLTRQASRQPRRTRCSVTSGSPIRQDLNDVRREPGVRRTHQFSSEDAP